MEKLPGNHDQREIGPVTLMCMASEARDVMEIALKEYEKHCASIREWKPGHRGSVYSFAYWLFRWSGLVKPDGTMNTETLKEK